MGELLNRVFGFSFDKDNPMEFTNIDFWLFFLVVIILFSLLQKNRLVRSIFLALVSFFFYYKTSGLFVFLLLFSVLFNYAMGFAISNAQNTLKKKWVIAISAIVNVAFLAFFKYAYFFTESFNELFHTNYEVFNYFATMANSFYGSQTFTEKILLPIGVSFFTFQSISYVVDIYRNEIKPVRNLFDYAFFVTYFPQLVAGPIVRAKDFIPQIYEPYSLTKNEFSWSIIQIVKGLIKKLIFADFIAFHFIDLIVDNPTGYPGFVSVLAMWGYSLQIYADFSGYTDIAIGISRLMGFRLLENFNSPYKARSVADFWRRWHKSLGSWLRDYLYIPLGGNRSGGLGTFLATFVIFVFLIFITQWYELAYVYGGLMLIYLIVTKAFPKLQSFVFRDMNLLITMVIGGLWHGASTNFVIWGAMNGLALIIYNHWKKISPYENSTNYFAIAWKLILVFNFITFTRIWFRMETEAGPMIMVKHIWEHFDFSLAMLGKVLWNFQAVFWIMLAGFITHMLPNKVKLVYERAFRVLPIPVQALSVAVIIFFVYQATIGVSKPFVYFQF